MVSTNADSIGSFDRILRRLLSDLDEKDLGQNGAFLLEDGRSLKDYFQSGGSAQVMLATLTGLPDLGVWVSACMAAGTWPFMPRAEKLGWAVLCNVFLRFGIGLCKHDRF